MTPTDAQARAVSVLTSLYFYAPTYWTEPTDDAGRQAQSQSQQNDIAIIIAALTDAYAQGRRDEKRELAEMLKGDGITVLRRRHAKG